MLTLYRDSALRVLRHLRSNRAWPVANQARCDLTSPSRGTRKRWSKGMIASALLPLGPVARFDPGHPLYVLAPSSQDRLQVKGVRCSSHMHALPAGSFLRITDETAISCPELLFVEMGAVMSEPVHLLLGMELTGRFSRSAAHPRDGDVAYDVEPVTTIGRMRAYMEGLEMVRGLEQARRVLDMLVENAWSPMEALVAALLVLPMESLGYDLGPIALNRPHHAFDNDHVNKQTRIPDILVRGTRIGLNYDGGDHFPLRLIANAGMRLGAEPGNAQLAKELERTLADVRSRLVADKRRDRDLASQGFVVFPMTVEDLLEEGGLDRVVLLLTDALEQYSKHNMAVTRRVLSIDGLARARQDLIWSLMPGHHARMAQQRLEERREAAAARRRDMMVEVVIDTQVV